MTKNTKTAKPQIVTAKSGRKLALVYRTIGQNFGTVAQLRSGATVVAETELVSYGHTGVARDRALALAETL